jgi:ubiquinone/menaquinone biosynthesis C-methylase UbiE
VKAAQLTPVESRYDREREFHDKEFSEGARRVVDKFYSVTRASRGAYEAYLASHAAGKRVLEYGCGQGSHAFFLAERGAEVTGIDISGEAIRQSRERAEREGVENVEFRVMNAEELEFEDGSFDLVCGTGIIHHLALDRAFAEIARVLGESGSAVFSEPLGHNPLINLYRRLTPTLRTRDEHPLRMADLDVARRHFRTVEPHFFHLQSLAAVPFRHTRAFPPLVDALEASDRVLFRTLPFTRRFAWQVVLVLAEPALSAVGRVQHPEAVPRDRAEERRAAL